MTQKFQYILSIRLFRCVIFMLSLLINIERVTHVKALLPCKLLEQSYHGLTLTTNKYYYVVIIVLGDFYVEQAELPW